MDGEVGAGDERGGDQQRRGRGEVARHVDPLEPQPLGGVDGRRGGPPHDARSGGLEHQLGVVAGRPRLDHGRAPVAEEPGEQHRGLHLRARHRQARSRSRAPPRPGARPAGGRPASRRRRPCGAAARRSAPSAGATGTRRRRARTGPPARRGSPARAASASPALPQSIGSSGARSPRRPAPRTTSVDSPSSTTSTPRARDGGERRLRVGRAAPALDAHVAVAERPDEQRPVRDRLVAGHADVARERRLPAATFTRPGCARRRPSTPAPRAPRRRAPPARGRSRAASASRRARARGAAARSPRC